jgi:hypothetical protein
MHCNQAATQPLTENWYSEWSPNSEAANRNPLRMRQMDVVGGMESKYLMRSSGGDKLKGGREKEGREGGCEGRVEGRRSPQGLIRAWSRGEVQEHVHAWPPFKEMPSRHL